MSNELFNVTEHTGHCLIRIQGTSVYSEKMNFLRETKWIFFVNTDCNDIVFYVRPNMKIFFEHHGAEWEMSSFFLDNKAQGKKKSKSR